MDTTNVCISEKDNDLYFPKFISILTSEKFYLDARMMMLNKNDDVVFVEQKGKTTELHLYHLGSKCMSYSHTILNFKTIDL